MPDVKLTGLTKRFGAFIAVDNIHLSANEGEMLTLLGPSGCGKTTTLRMIAGLEDPDAGTIAIGSRPLYDSARRINVPAENRGLGMVFQSYAIWPHMTVAENVAYPLRMRRVPKAQAAELVRKVLETVGLSGFESKPSTKLSGGQQQRVAFARALIFQPSLLLLDEPLSNLDAKLREHMRFELKVLKRKLGLTSVYVTHDQEEALTLSDRIVVMNGGHIEQVGTPQEIYEQPASRFVAEFIGKANMIALLGGVEIAGGEVSVSLPTKGETLTFRLRSDCLRPASKAIEGDRSAGRDAAAHLFVRPEKISLKQVAGESDDIQIPGTVKERFYIGERDEYLVEVSPATTVRVNAGPSTEFAVGEDVRLSIARRDLAIYA